MKELWKDIPGFKNYQVSNIGNVRSVTHEVSNHKGSHIKKGSLLKSSNNGGYRQVVLYRMGPKTIKVHRLVALAFIPNLECKETVNHKNGIKDDNRVENLEWCTRSENTKHKFVSGLDTNKGINHPASKLSESDIIDIRKHASDKATRIMLSKKYGVSISHLHSIIKRKAWTHI